MDERNIKVSFPKEMRVESPEIDAIKANTNHISNWLHNDFREIIKPLQVLPSIPGVLDDMKSRLVEQFQIHFSGQVAVQMKAREANIRVAQQKALLVEQHIEKRYNQLKEMDETIREKYASHAVRTEQEHSSYLRHLDSHSYEIVEEIYPKQIQEKFSYASGQFWGEIARHTAESTVARSVCLQEGYNDARENIEAFLELRNNFYKTIDEISTDMVAEGSYDLPFWFVVVEDIKTGDKRTEVFFNWDFENDNRISVDRKNEIQQEALRNCMQSDHLDEVTKEDYAKFMEYFKGNYSVNTNEIKRFNKECGKVTIG